MTENKNKKEENNVCSPNESRGKVSINPKKRNYEDLSENMNIKSVLAFVPRIVQLNGKKNE
ncbi:hypothetical protein PVLDE_1101840 [Plasmodium vinckei lentum]|uniref:Uncharacterized protein n=1 Tax=Plasmodium vinckei lentum TaxID=138297 RepID=A0A6V7S9Q7_PLAVN|nr:hypothetical protein PVLDE_1101840 [Plasmodium vinckei lentum]